MGGAPNHQVEECGQGSDGGQIVTIKNRLSIA